MKPVQILLRSLVINLFVLWTNACGSIKDNKKMERTIDKEMQQSLDTMDVRFTPPPGNYEGSQTVTIVPENKDQSESLGIEVLNGEGYKLVPCASVAPAKGVCLSVFAHAIVSYQLTDSQTSTYGQGPYKEEKEKTLKSAVRTATYQIK